MVGLGPECVKAKMYPAERERFEEREKQVQLAKAHGEEHIGSAVEEVSKKHKTTKYKKRQAQMQK